MEKIVSSDLEWMVGFRHKDTKAQSGRKERKKKEVLPQTQLDFSCLEMTLTWECRHFDDRRNLIE